MRWCRNGDFIIGGDKPASSRQNSLVVAVQQRRASIISINTQANTQANSQVSPGICCFRAVEIEIASCA